MKFIKFMRIYMIICDFFKSEIYEIYEMYENLWIIYENLLKSVRIYGTLYENSMKSMRFIKSMRIYMIICEVFQIYENLWGTYENLLKPMHENLYDNL